jgi:PLP dependent protein
MTRATLVPIAQNLAAVHARMQAAAARANRDPAGIRLLAVSKACPTTAIAAAYAEGQMEFGENYLQEALPKLGTLSGRPGLIWHFIGSLQSNKTRAVAKHFDWVHTVDRERIAQRISDQRPAGLPPLNACIEVRFGDEPGKSGIPPEQVPTLAKFMGGLPHLRLRGLMCVPPPSNQILTQRSVFDRMRNLFEQLNRQGHGLDTLSMGMSGDFEAAILDGATLIRLGTAIFGPRPAKHS